MACSVFDKLGKRLKNQLFSLTGALTLGHDIVICLLILFCINNLNLQSDKMYTNICNGLKSTICPFELQ